MNTTGEARRVDENHDDDHREDADRNAQVEALKALGFPTRPQPSPASEGTRADADAATQGATTSVSGSSLTVSSKSAGDNGDAEDMLAKVDAPEDQVVASNRPRCSAGTFFHRRTIKPRQRWLGEPPEGASPGRRVFVLGMFHAPSHQVCDCSRKCACWVGCRCRGAVLFTWFYSKARSRGLCALHADCRTS